MKKLRKISREKNISRNLAFTNQPVVLYPALPPPGSATANRGVNHLPGFPVITILCSCTRNSVIETLIYVIVVYHVTIVVIGHEILAYVLLICCVVRTAGSSIITSLWPCEVADLACHSTQ